MTRTTILTSILALVMLGGCDNNTPVQNIDQEIIALERSALDKWAQSNTGGYVNISADDVTWFDFNPGAQLRMDGIQEVRKFLEPLSGNIPPHTYDLVDPKVQVYGSTAVLTFHWKASMADGTPLGGWKATSVYTLKDDNWRQVHAHWSVVQSVE
ncbi:MAG: nuclear transport factor 2 family protein [Bacteroidales bacterium]|nr:nuclear transport factor 2 family protein [Bacteroidales bacterium]